MKTPQPDQLIKEIKVAFDNKEYQETLIKLECLLENPNHGLTNERLSDLYDMQGCCYFHLENDEAAIQSYIRACIYDANSISAHHRMAVTYISLAEIIMKDDVGSSYSIMQNAKRALDKAVSLSKSAQPELLHTRALWYEQSAELAILQKQPCVELYQNAIYHYDQALILCDKDADIDFCQTVLEGRYLCRIDLADILLDNKNYHDALRQYQWAQDFNHSNPKVLTNMAWCYIHQELYDEAIDCLLKAFTFINTSAEESADILINNFNLLIDISKLYLFHTPLAYEHDSILFKVRQSLITARHIAEILQDKLPLDEERNLKACFLELIRQYRTLLPHTPTHRDQALETIDWSNLKISALTMIEDDPSVPTYDGLVQMTHNETIRAFNQSISQGVLWPLDHLALVIKKFQHNRIGTIVDAERLFNILMAHPSNFTHEQYQSLVTEMMEVYKRRCLEIQRPNKSQEENNAEWMRLIELYYFLNPSTYTLNALASAAKMLGHFDTAMCYYLKEAYQFIELDAFSWNVIVDIILDTKGSNPLTNFLKNGDITVLNLDTTLISRFPFKDGMPFSYQLKILNAVLGLEHIDVNDKLKYLNKVFTGRTHYNDDVARLIIKDFLKHNKLKEAFEIYYKIDVPAEPTLQILIVALVKNRFYRAALELLDIAMTKPFEYFKFNRPTINNDHATLDLHSYYVKGGGCPGYRGVPAEIAQIMMIAMMRDIKSLRNLNSFSLTIITGIGDGDKNQKSQLRASVESFLTSYFTGIGTIFNNHTNRGCFELRLSSDDLKKLGKRKLVSHHEPNLAKIKLGDYKQNIPNNNNNMFSNHRNPSHWQTQQAPPSGRWR